MPKTAVQTQICDICGADVREGSLFCYNCGGSLKRDDPGPAQTPASVPPASANGTTKATAASKREARLQKRTDRGPIEVVWAPREGISMIYVAAGAILLMIALALFIVAMFLK